ncbi:hypothetical protein TIFTF001_009814 [Ficus carica]|uniref:Uncharacterized protein n=1 Tax=Ficus carica TaxID=3494 RepID=A0AA88AB28_FICCA|nr:hypothetical protein TIFTF001_009814 [Ficus carica]
MLGLRRQLTSSETTVWGGHGRRSTQIWKTTVDGWISDLESLQRDSRFGRRPSWGTTRGWWWDRRKFSTDSFLFSAISATVPGCPAIVHAASADDSLHAAAFDLRDGAAGDNTMAGMVAAQPLQPP